MVTTNVNLKQEETTKTTSNENYSDALPMNAIEENKEPNTTESNIKWRWVVIIASFILHVLANGHDNTFGVLLPALTSNKSTVHEQSYVRASMVGSILQFMYMGGGVVAGIVAQRWGIRVTAVIGALFAALGLLLSSVATNVYTLYVTYGIISGLGLSFLYLSANTIIPHYFDQNRALANTLVTSGGGFGTIVFSSLRAALTQSFEWSNIMYVEAAVLLLAVPCGLVLITPKSNMKNNNTNDNQSEMDALCQENHSEKPVTQCDIIRMTQFQIFSFMCFLKTFNYQLPLMYLPSHAAILGIDKTQAAYLLSIVGVADVACRILFGVLANYLGARRVYVLTGCLCVGAVSSCAMPLMSTYSHLVVYSLALGVFLGGWITLYMVIMVDVMGVEYIEQACGLAMTFEAFGPLFMNPLSGLIIDTTGKSYIIFVIGGCCQAIAAALTLPLKNYMKYI